MSGDDDGCRRARRSVGAARWNGRGMLYDGRESWSTNRVASRSSAGIVPTTSAEDACIDIVLLSPGAKFSAVHAPRAAKAGAVVIDNTSHFRMDPDVPLVVPEVNPEAIAGYTKRGIIANPELLDHPDGRRAEAAARSRHGSSASSSSTYQSVSGAGRRRWTSCSRRPAASTSTTRSSASISPSRSPSTAFPISTSSWTTARPRRNGRWRSRRARSSIPISPSRDLRARAGVHRPCRGGQRRVRASAQRHEAREALQKAPGVTVLDHRADEGYVTQVEAAGEDAVFVSRIRQDPTVPHGLSFWVVSDNLRKGAALNAVQIAEALIERHLQKTRRRRSARPAEPRLRMRRGGSGGAAPRRRPARR